MSWIQKLIETYENCQPMIGTEKDEQTVPLLPICHTTQKAQIEITLNEQGNFTRARLIPPEESRTIIPCTESSSGRTSGEAAHPLCDKLQYIAADYKKFGCEKDSYFESYCDQLEKWCSYQENKKIRLIYKYIKQGTVISDLVDQKILIIGSDGNLCFQRPYKKVRKEDFDIFDLLPGRLNKNGNYENWQADAFVRWKVEIPRQPESAVCNDPEIVQSWINYYSSTKKTKALCYVSGEEQLIADQHPAKIRNDGDKAKLISSGKSKDKVDDGCGFTFSGRFTNADQVASVGFENTQKAHFALRWIISRQGFRSGDLAIVAWATNGSQIPQPTDNPLSILENDDLPMEKGLSAYTAQEVGLNLKKKIAGYKASIDNSTDIVVMGLDSATPGRLSIIYYRELTGSDFLKRIEDWHSSCAWRHKYGFIKLNDEQNEKKKGILISFIGAPSPSDIAEAVYGRRVDEKLKKSTVTRLLPCIIDGQPIPRDLVESAVRRASNRIGIKDSKDKNEYEWEKTLSIACALYKKFKQGKENYDMALDESRTTRDYLYGRLLAISERIEEVALYKSKEKRATNATRYMQQFSQHPFRTWNQIHAALTPYIVRLGGAFYYKKMIADIISLFNPDDFTSDKPLSGEYLLGYYCQREKLMEKEKNSQASTDNDNNDEETSEE